MKHVPLIMMKFRNVLAVLEEEIMHLLVVLTLSLRLEVSLGLQLSDG